MYAIKRPGLELCIRLLFVFAALLICLANQSEKSETIRQRPDLQREAGTLQLSTK